MQLSPDDLRIIVERAQHQYPIAGYYNLNRKVELSGESYLVRLPLDNAADMDLRIWPETEILDIAYRHGIPCPRLLGVWGPSSAQVQEYVSGRVVEDHWPRGTPLPPRFVKDVAALLGRLRNISRPALPSPPPDWPLSGDTKGLMQRLIDKSREVYNFHNAEYGWLYAALGVPTDPFSVVEPLADALGERGFVLCHSDIHRGNCILRDGDTVLVDWETALYGDPAYETATHLHKTAYKPHEESRFLELVTHHLPSASARRLVSDVAIYRVHERVKSIIVDAVRYRRRVTCPRTAETTRVALAGRLARKLHDVAPIWGGSRCLPVTVEEALRA